MVILRSRKATLANTQRFVRWDVTCFPSEQAGGYDKKHLKVFRLEAVRAGFKKAWQDLDYATIIAVARKIPENVLQEDLKLLMWYDQALTRTGEE